MSFFNRFLNRPDAASGGETVAGEAAADRAAGQVPRYPPVDDGLPAVDPEEMLATQDDLMRRIRVSSGYNPSEFDRLMRRPALNLAAFLQLLPATRDNHHRGPGGAFRFSLEVAFYALQASEGAIFTGLEHADKRRELEPKWRYATFLAGLCVCAHVPLTDMIVLDAQGRHTWAPFEQTLWAFCRQREIDRYFLRWHPSIRLTSDADQRARTAATAFVLNQIIPTDCISDISGGSPRILAALMASVTGMVRAGDHNSLHNLVSRARQDMIARDLKAQPDLYGRFQLGTQLEPHLIDAMRRLVRGGAWPVNTGEGMVFLGDAGLFVRWPEGAALLTGQLESDRIVGAPKDEDLLARLLFDAGIVQSDSDDEDRPVLYRRLDVGGAEVDVVKLSAPDILFPRERPAPMAFRVRSGVPAATATAGAPAPAVAADVADVADAADAADAAGDAAAAVADEGRADAPLPAAPEAAPGRAAAWEKINLDEPIRLVMQAVAEHVRETGAAGQVAWTERGLALGVDLVKSFGLEVEFVINGLAKSNWLSVDPMYPARVKHNIDIGGETVSCVLLQERLGLLIHDKRPADAGGSGA